MIGKHLGSPCNSIHLYSFDFLGLSLKVSLFGNREIQIGIEEEKEEKGIRR